MSSSSFSITNLMRIPLLFLIVVLIYSCKKDTSPTLLEQMPRRTEVGAEKLVGIVNDEYIFNNNHLGLFSVSMYSWYTESELGYLHIDAYYHYYNDEYQVKEERILIKLHGVYGMGSHVINPNLGVAFFTKNGTVFHTDSINLGELTITKLDTINNIYSGTFHLDLINYENNEQIKITNGWFDISD